MHACLPKETENRGLQNWAPVNAALKYVSRIGTRPAVCGPFGRSFPLQGTRTGWVRADAARALMCGPLQVFSSLAHAPTAGRGYTSSLGLSLNTTYFLRALA